MIKRVLRETTLQLTSTINKSATVDAGAAAVVTLSTRAGTKCLNYRMKRAEIIKSVLRISVTGFVIQKQNG